MPVLTLDTVTTLPPTKMLNRTSRARSGDHENMTGTTTKIFVVAHPQLVATSISRSLRNAGWVVGEAMASPSALADVSVEGNDVILLVENTSGTVSGAPTGTVLATIRRVFPTIGIVLLSANGGSSATGDARVRVLSSATNISGLCTEMSRLAGTVPQGGPGLTGRHLEILQLIARGATTDEAGVILGIASKTVNNHLSAAYQRLGARNLTQAVLAAARAGLIDTGIA